MWYTAVAKIFTMFEHTHKGGRKVTWRTGTAQLISPDVLQTSAHCVLHACDECVDVSPATSIKVYLGYNGKSSIGNADLPDGVEFRSADSFAVLRSHYENKVARSKTKCTFDVASIKVASAFKYVKPLRFEATPVTGERDELGVVGYPADMAYRSENGAQMYMQFKKDQSWDLSKSKNNMLTYTISTFRGKCGV
jgi:V8-like Glu-specific endopeptidase